MAAEREEGSSVPSGSPGSARAFRRPPRRNVATAPVFQAHTHARRGTVRASSPASGAEQAGSRSDESELWSVVTRIAERVLPDFLMKQRWYPAKDAGRSEVAAAALVPFPDLNSGLRSRSGPRRHRGAGPFASSLPLPWSPPAQRIRLSSAQFRPPEVEMEKHGWSTPFPSTALCGPGSDCSARRVPAAEGSGTEEIGGLRLGRALLSIPSAPIRWGASR
jgi:hypothetical protein